MTSQLPGGGVPLTGDIRPQNDADIAMVQAQYLYGGLRVVAEFAALVDLNEGTLKLGMWAWSLADQELFQLVSIGPSVWEPLPLGTKDHAELTANLDWLASTHTGTPNMLAAFDGAGAAAYIDITANNLVSHPDLADLGWSVSKHSGPAGSFALFGDGGAAETQLIGIGLWKFNGEIAVRNPLALAKRTNQDWTSVDGQGLLFPTQVLGNSEFTQDANDIDVTCNFTGRVETTCGINLEHFGGSVTMEAQLSLRGPTDIILEQGSLRHANVLQNSESFITSSAIVNVVSGSKLRWYLFQSVGAQNLRSSNGFVTYRRV